MWRIVLQHLQQSIENVHFDSVLHGNIMFEITTSEGKLSCLFMERKGQLNAETDHLEVVLVNQPFVDSLKLTDTDAFNVDHNTSRTDLNILLERVGIDWNQAIPEVLSSLKECDTFVEHMSLKQYDMFVREMESLA